MVKRSSWFYFNNTKTTLLVSITPELRGYFSFLFKKNGTPPKDWEAFLKRVRSNQESKRVLYAFEVLIKEYLRHSDQPNEGGDMNVYASIHFHGKTKDFLGFSGIREVGSPAYYSNI